MSDGVSRRSFIKTAGLSAAAASLAGVGREALGAQQAAGGVAGAMGPGMVEVALTVNGAARKVKIDPAATLLETLRVDCNLTGAKEVCDRASCGACSVLVDGKLVCSCMMLTLDAQGCAVTTVEGLVGADGKPDAVQAAFIKHDALQCGFCTPGFVIAARALLNVNPKPTLGEIKSALAGNICRCGAYTNIFNAVLEASGQAVIADAG
jgi:aerobic-type carbon monoxide dehydrogenase small subunit (CoxS/CutS family)